MLVVASSTQIPQVKTENLLVSPAASALAEQKGGLGNDKNLPGAALEAGIGNNSEKLEPSANGVVRQPDETLKRIKGRRPLLRRSVFLLLTKQQQMEPPSRADRRYSTTNI